MVDAGRTHPRLILPTGHPSSSDDWSRVELLDPCAKLVLEKMDADLRPGNMAVAKLTGASLMREFLEHQVPPLCKYLLLMWRPCLSPAVLADEDLAAVLQSLVEGDVARLEGAPMPLFL